MNTYMILELYEKSEFVFAESIHIYIYTYEYIYDPGIIRETQLALPRATCSAAALASVRTATSARDAFAPFALWRVRRVARM